MDELQTINLEDFLEQDLKEEKVERTYTRSWLQSSFKKYKEAKAGTTTIEIWTNKHFDERFKQRFVDGDIPVSKKNDIGNSILFKNLPNWKPRTQQELNRVLLDGINKIIKEHKLEIGGYFIISEGTRMIIPAVVGNIENEPKTKAIVISTIFHTSMSAIDKFKVGGKDYDAEDIVVERKLEEFYSVLTEDHESSFGIIDDIEDRELELYLTFYVEGAQGVFPSHTIIVVD